jgi:hypothetical protein
MKLDCLHLWTKHSVVTSLVLLCCAWSQVASAHEWTDSTGQFKVVGDLIAMDEKEIVIKLEKSEKGKELLAFPIDKLSEEDKKFLASEELASRLQSDGEKHSWTLRNGLTILGKVVAYGRRDVTVQRRRGKVYVNDRPMETLPEIYRRMIPRIVENFENKKFEDERAFLDWVLQLRGAPKTFRCEGVLIELVNGEEYAMPFFAFSEKDLKALQPGWEKWLASQGNESEMSEQHRQSSLYLQSQAAAYQMQQQAEMMQIARLQLQLTAVNTGAIDMWEVYLYPGPGVMAYPTSVVVYAANSDIASRMAIANNPGYVVGPVRKIAGRRF